jgi:membrane-associated phospholipid phosphatase
VKPVQLFSFAALFCVFLCPDSTNAQNLSDTTTVEPSTGKWKRIVTVPAILFGAGLIATTDNEVLDRYEVREERNEHIPNFHTHVDDYMQFIPLAAVYALKLTGLKSEHGILPMTALVLKSELYMAAIVFPMKKLSSVQRPDGSNYSSFPSGHTAQAFAMATVIHLEYGKGHPWVSALAYTTASSVGLMRIMNNKHWASDVLAGAGVGILATNLAYMTRPNKFAKKKNALSSMIITPTYAQRSVGFYLSIPLN